MKTKSISSRTLACRLREIRIQCYGVEGVEELAMLLDLPALTWRNYEAGVTIPGLQLLDFVCRTKVNPTWLLTGTGHRYQVDSSLSFREDEINEPIEWIEK